MSTTIDTDLNAYGLSPTKGFLSPNPPLTSFAREGEGEIGEGREDGPPPPPGGYFAPWDDLIPRLSSLLASKSLAQEINSLPLLDASKLLSSERDLRRAYVILAFLIHGFVFGGSPDGKPIEVVPPQLSDPFLTICSKLRIQPVLNYAGLTLWNWKTKGGEDILDGPLVLDRFASIASFTGSEGEDTFYHIPVLIEAEGGPLVQLLLDAVVATKNGGDKKFVTSALVTTRETLGRMAQHLSAFYGRLDSDLFYHGIRPFLSGGKGMEAKGLPRGIVFQREDGTEEAFQCAGGSAAQSSLIQFLDIVLGVEHKGPGGQGPPKVFEEMRRYMPGEHRDFLREVSRLPSLRQFVERNSEDETLCSSYNDCMEQLKSWRGKHIAVVSKYIVQPARKASQVHLDSQNRPSTNGSKESEEDDFSSLQQPEQSVGEAVQGRREQADDGDDVLRGTGGTALIPFLRQSRDETIGVRR